MNYRRNSHPMGILDILGEAVGHVSGLMLAGVVGTDGIGVEMIMDNDALPHDYQVAELEIASLISHVSGSAHRLGVGMVYDLVLETEMITYILSVITPEYYAVVGVHPDSNITRARHAVWQIVKRCQTEL